MPRIEGGVKLKHGSRTKLAAKYGVSAHHVSEVAKGEREGRAELVRDIRRMAKRQEQKAA